jgi:hypothetical protein
MGKGEFTLVSEGKIEARRSTARELVEAIKAIIAHIPSDDMPIETTLHRWLQHINPVRAIRQCAVKLLR